MTKYFSGSFPELISGSRLKNLNSTLKYDHIKPTNLINNFSSFFNNYILPNLFVIILFSLIIFFLFIKYILKKKKDKLEQFNPPDPSCHQTTDIDNIDNINNIDDINTGVNNSWVDQLDTNIINPYPDDSVHFGTAYNRESLNKLATIMFDN